VPVVLFDLPAKEGPKNGIVLKAIEGLKKLKPGAAGRGRTTRPDRGRQLRRAPGPAGRLRPGHRGHRRAHGLEARPVRQDRAATSRPHAIVASNTSGLSITQAGRGCPRRCARFCGIHFFNPPRYMQLVELIPTPDPTRAILDQLETFVTTTLGKGVVRAKDTPNFVANRVGVFSMLAVMHPHGAPSASASTWSTT
jgi:3-hydroxyacyl-CoA dehydrogenase